MKTKSITRQQSDFFGNIYNKYREELRLYFLAYTHNVMDAEDMIHNLFIKLMRLDLIAESTVRNLIFTTARRIIIDDVRHQFYVRQAEQYMLDNVKVAQESGVYDKIQRDEVRALEDRCLQNMPEKRATVYRMWRDEKSMKEIAESMNISIRTAESHTYNATRQMKEFIRKAM